MGHIYKVNKLVEKLRSYLLGQDVRFETLLPTAMEQACEEHKAVYLADRLLFEIASQQDLLQGEELKRMYLWLYEAVLYLLTEVASVDHTIAGVVQLISQPFDIREMIFDVKEKEFPHLARDQMPPITIEDIEEALVHMNEEDAIKKRYSKLHSAMK